MLTLTIRTDKPEAEIGLYNDTTQKAYQTWNADRMLAETIHNKIRDLLSDNKLTLQDLESLAIYEGPGSFTGLRIGFSVANTLAYGLGIPIVTTTGDDWKEKAIENLSSGQGQEQVLPEYGSPPHITKPKH
jgi:tRNA threonylcarbamoyladenosine biosynthesis protein TsaB